MVHLHTSCHRNSKNYKNNSHARGEKIRILEQTLIILGTFMTFHENTQILGILGSLGGLHLARVTHYSIVVNMKFYRHERNSNPDRCGENQTC